MSQLEIKHLKLIRAIATTGNMTKAARMLFLTQPALSQQLKEIEARLEAQLFTRTHKKMVLTAVGKKMLTAAQSVIETIEDVELEIARTISGDSGDLKLGTQCMFCYKWLPGVLNRFQRKYPNITFDLGSSWNLIRELETKTYDLVIAGYKVESDQVSSYPLFTDDLVCIVSQDSPLASRPFVEFKDLADQCLIGNKEKSRNGLYQKIFKHLNIEPKKYMMIEQSQAMIEMVAAGFGLSIVPRWAVKEILEFNRLAALPITRKGIDVTWHAVVLKNETLSVFQKEFIRLVSRMPVVTPAEGAIG
jgi:LysR family transcriptional regulator for metE and metH